MARTYPSSSVFARGSTGLQGRATFRGMRGTGRSRVWRIGARARVLGALGAIGLGVGSFGLGCREDLPSAQPCRNVPDGGCPRSRGVACEDPTCRAVYLCREDQTWELERLCPERPTDAAATADRSVQDASVGPRDAGITPPPGASGGPGCLTLQAPDCPLATAYGCPNGCCGCEDLFVCERGGWTTWGTCGDAGIVPNKP